MGDSGYTPIPHWMLAKLYSDNLTGRELRVLLYIIRKTVGYHKKSDKIPYGQIVKGTGIDHRSVIRIVKSLEEKGWISVKKKQRSINIITLVGSGTDATRGSGTDVVRVVASTPPSKNKQKSDLEASPLREASHKENKSIVLNDEWLRLNEEDFDEL